MKIKQNNPSTPVDLYHLSLLILSDINSEITNSFKMSFPSAELLQINKLKASILQITDSVLHVGKASSSTLDLVEAVKKVI